jgi:hypothetical protein
MTLARLSELALRARLGLAAVLFAATLSACGGGHEGADSPSMPSTAQARLNDADCDRKPSPTARRKPGTRDVFAPARHFGNTCGPRSWPPPPRRS